MTEKKRALDLHPPVRKHLALTFFQEQASIPCDRVALDRILRAYAKKTKQSILRSDELLAVLPEADINDKKMWQKLCRKRAVRSQSGVAVIALLTKNFGCPGRCVYCPTPKGMPKSYLPTEPAVLRAITAKFSPSIQIKNRLRALHATGHDTSKVELIVMGGTWSAIPMQYRSQYIRACYHALNSADIARETDPALRKKSPNAASVRLPTRMQSLIEEQRINESTTHRCVGLTLETRPDWITPDEIRSMRKFGCTRVEIGVQNLDDKIQKLTKRGHGVAEVAYATQLLRDHGFKIVYHMMLNLPGATPESDVAMFKTLFSDPRFCPDQVKIYPCVLTKDAELEEWHADGRWTPYSDEELVSTITNIKKYIPEYCRVIRVIRDIPGTDIIAGSKTSNLRQLMQNKGMICRCIRCREIKHDEVGKLDLVTREYETEGGREIFLSYEDTKKDKLVGLLRLRLPVRHPERSADHALRLRSASQSFAQDDVVSTESKDIALTIFPSLHNAALIRELHVYGEHTPVGTTGKSAQHGGVGSQLLEEAERIAKENGYPKVAVISGVGVREYYQKKGYKLEDGYMTKQLLFIRGK